jgi:hypothetical protein
VKIYPKSFPELKRIKLIENTKSFSENHWNSITKKKSVLSGRVWEFLMNFWYHKIFLVKLSLKSVFKFTHEKLFTRYSLIKNSPRFLAIKLIEI